MLQNVNHFKAFKERPSYSDRSSLLSALRLPSSRRRVDPRAWRQPGCKVLREPWLKWLK